MKLNTLSPDVGSKPAKTRLGRGIGSGLGKTCGKGHKGQKARAGGFHKINFEGGQMPIQRRLPKFGFKSSNSKFVDEVTLSTLDKVQSEVIDLSVLKEANIIEHVIRTVKVISTGEITKKVTLKGLRVSKNARKAIESLGGKIED